MIFFFFFFTFILYLAQGGGGPLGLAGMAERWKDFAETGKLLGKLLGNSNSPTLVVWFLGNNRNI